MYISQSSELRTNRTIDFNDYRKKIADPNFIDELEIEFNVRKNTLSSIKKYESIRKMEFKIS